MTAVDGDVQQEQYVRAIVAQILDPEVPALTIDDLGVLRDVRVHGSRVEVVITPTYSGCPAIDAIRSDIEKALQDNGFLDVSVRSVLAPAWTTDWISDEGRRKLAAFGIAPPGRRRPTRVTLSVRCPHCGSPDTREVSRFGSTACTSLWSCNSCRDPFEHFKAI